MAAGMFFLVAGATLRWVVNVDLPFFNTDALGAILIVAGIVALTVSALGRSGRGNPGIGSGVGLIAAGAIVYWALDFNLSHVNDHALAVILMVAGVVLAAVSSFITAAHLQEGVAAGVAMMAIGSATLWAVHVQLPEINTHALSVILMVVGGLGLGAAVAAQLRYSRVVRRYSGVRAPL